MIINIDIVKKRPSVAGTPVIVCGNSGYTIEFTFDDEWASAAVKTARFVYVKGGAVKYQDVAFSGNTVAVPILSEIREVYVGVYAGELRTTTPARIPCERSILCGTGTEHEEPDPDVYNQILEAVNQLIGSVGNHPARTDNPHKVTAEQVGARPDTWMPTAADVGARPDTWTPTAEQVGARPADWTPTAEQVGARPDTWMPTAEQVGARPDTWMPTAEQVGARPNTWMPTAEQVGARPNTWMPTAEQVGAAPSGFGLGAARPFAASEIDDITAPGFYDCNESMTIGGYERNRWWMQVYAYGAGTSFVTQRLTMFWGAHAYTLVRHKVNATWGEWAWENPPMAPDKEYRTTERSAEKPVYVKRIDFVVAQNYGSTTATNSLYVPHGVSNFGASVRCFGFRSTYQLPYFGSTGVISIHSFNASSIVVKVDKETIPASAHLVFDFYYTKSA